MGAYDNQGKLVMIGGVQYKIVFKEEDHYWVEPVDGDHNGHYERVSFLESLLDK